MVLVVAVVKQNRLNRKLGNKQLFLFFTPSFFFFPTCRSNLRNFCNILLFFFYCKVGKQKIGQVIYKISLKFDQDGNFKLEEEEEKGLKQPLLTPISVLHSSLIKTCLHIYYETNLCCLLFSFFFGGWVVLSFRFPLSPGFM